MSKTPRTTLPPGIARVLKRLHYPLDVILPCNVVEQDHRAIERIIRAMWLNRPKN
ncbi:hypothetical protein P3T22_004871 [Paraburkholderia sp. GAS348]